MQNVIEFRGGPLDGERFEVDEIFGVEHITTQVVEEGQVHVYMLANEYRRIAGKLYRRRYYKHDGSEPRRKTRKRRRKRDAN
jgi:hypothetical protein